MKKLSHWINCAVILLSFVSCQSKQEQKLAKKPLLGVWRMEMNLGEKQLPFNFTLDVKNDHYAITSTQQRRTIPPRQRTRWSYQKIL